MYMHACIHTCMHTHSRIHVYIDTCIHKHTCVCIRMHSYIRRALTFLFKKNRMLAVAGERSWRVLCFSHGPSLSLSLSLSQSLVLSPFSLFLSRVCVSARALSLVCEHAKLNDTHTCTPTHPQSHNHTITQTHKHTHQNQDMIRCINNCS